MERWIVIFSPLTSLNKSRICARTSVSWASWNSHSMISHILIKTFSTVEGLGASLLNDLNLTFDAHCTSACLMFLFYWVRIKIVRTIQTSARSGTALTGMQYQHFHQHFLAHFSQAAGTLFCPLYIRFSERFIMALNNLHYYVTLTCSRPRLLAFLCRPLV